MSYVALRFDVEAVDGDAWSDALLDAGALSVDAADPRADMPDEAAVFDEGNADPQWWPVSRLTALLAADADPAVVLRDAANRIARAAPPYEASIVPDQDWVSRTQAQFQPIRIADDLWIVPSWCTAPDRGAINLTLDPGLAFGTGAHPTTRLCLAWLRARVGHRTSVLDYGCGSGILAIAAAKLGAPRVVGTDIDDRAVRAGIDNASANGVRVTFVRVDDLCAERFDIVVANILANPLRILAPALAARTDEGGCIALAGILVAQADEVIRTYAPWFDIAVHDRAGDWVLLAGERRATG
jgi:ribosomal protein L11 methyltransferase